MPPSPPIYFFIYLFNEGVAGTDRLLVAPADRIDAAYVAPVAISPTPIGWHEPTPRPRPHEFFYDVRKVGLWAMGHILFNYDTNKIMEVMHIR